MIFVTEDTLLTFVSLYHSGLSHLKKERVYLPRGIEAQRKLKLVSKYGIVGALCMQGAQHDFVVNGLLTACYVCVRHIHFKQSYLYVFYHLQ